MTTKEAIKTGLEGVEPEGSRTPYLQLLQGMSKAVSDGKGKPGDIYNPITDKSSKTQEVIAVGYEWRVILFKLDENGEVVEGDKGPEFQEIVTDRNSEKLEGRTYFNADGLPTAQKQHVWKVVVPGTSEVLQLVLKKSNLYRHDDILNIIKSTGQHMSNTVLVVSGEQAKKGPHKVLAIGKGRDASVDEAKLAFEVWNGASEGEVPF